MKAFGLIFTLFVLVSCSRSDDYETGTAQLGLNFIAKSMCTCIWVMDRGEDFCREYVSLKQVNPSVSIDWQKKEVVTSLFWFWRGRAEFIGSQKGCRSVF